jgi:hypothetical protein
MRTRVKLCLAVAITSAAAWAASCGNFSGTNDNGGNPTLDGSAGNGEGGADGTAPAVEGGMQIGDGGTGMDATKPCDPDASTVLASDPSNCGACGHNCLGGGCEAGTCTPGLVLGSLNHPVSVAVDSTSVYVTEYAADGGIYAVPKAGGDAGALAFGNELAGIAITGAHVFFSSVYDDYIEDALQPTLHTSSATSPYFLVADSSLVVGVNTVSDAEPLYWPDTLGAPTVPFGGGVGSGDSPTALAMDDSGVYVMLVRTGGGGLMRYDRGFTGRTASGGIANGGPIIASNNTLYFLTGGTAIQTLPNNFVANATPSGNFATGLVGAVALVEGKDAFYVAVSNGVSTVDKTTGTLTPLIAGQPNVVGVAPDAKAVFFITDTATARSGGLWRWVR